MFKKFLTILLSIIIFSSFSLNVSAYSGSNAATYAKKYAKNYNSNYPKMNYDCTNFVSQCVKAGGVSVKAVPTKNIKYKHISDVYKTESYWNCAKYTRTTTVAGIKIYSKTGYVWTSTWSIVDKNQSGYFGFYQYMKNRGANVKEYAVNTESKLNTFIKNCSVGDVLQYKSSSSSAKSHSVIVTNKTYDSKNKRYNMKIAYHTNDTEPTDFRTVSWAKFGKNAKWTVIKFNKVS